MYRDAETAVLVIAFNGRIFGLDPATGQQRWAYDIGNDFARNEVELLISTSRIYACDGRSLVCLEYPSGRWLGSTPLPPRGQGRPTMVLQGDRLYVATRGVVTCFDDGGKMVWHEPFGGSGYGSVALGFPGNVRQADDAGTR